jgi:hypothetical protein
MSADMADKLAPLGTAIATYRIRRLKIFAFYFWGIFFLLLGIGIFCITMYAAFWLPSGRDSKLTMAFGGIVGFGMATGGLAMVRRGQRDRGYIIVLCTEGIARITGSLIESLRWRAIRSVAMVQNQAAVDTAIEGTSVFQLTADTGAVFLVPCYLQAFGELQSAIERETLKHLLSEAEIRLKGGERLEYGPLTLDDAAWQYDNAILPWNDLSTVTVERGYLTIRTKSANRCWLQLDVRYVPNVHVVVALAAHRMGWPSPC